jgi:hypothetical protein
MWTQKTFRGTPERGALQYLVEFLNQTGLTRSEFNVIGSGQPPNQELILLYWESAEMSSLPDGMLPCQQDILNWHS